MTHPNLLAVGGMGANESSNIEIPFDSFLRNLNTGATFQSALDTFTPNLRLNFGLHPVVVPNIATRFSNPLIYIR